MFIYFYFFINKVVVYNVIVLDRKLISICARVAKMESQQQHVIITVTEAN